MSDPKILVIKTGLFGDDETVEQAVGDLSNTSTLDLTDVSEMDGDDWDAVIGEVMSAAKIITL